MKNLFEKKRSAYFTAIFLLGSVLLSGCTEPGCGTLDGERLKEAKSFEKGFLETVPFGLPWFQESFLDGEIANGVIANPQCFDDNFWFYMVNYMAERN